MLIFTSSIFAVVFIVLLSPTRMASQFYDERIQRIPLRFQDSQINVHESISELERQLFPDNSSFPCLKTFYGCVTYSDSLILYLRPVRPQPDSVLKLLKSIAFSKDFNENDISALNALYHSQIFVFQIEWETAFRQQKNSRCEHFEKQLLLLFAFDRCIKALESQNLHPTPQKYFAYLLEYNRAATIIRFHKESVAMPGRTHHGLPDEEMKWLVSLTEDQVENYENLILPSSEYLKYIMTNWYRRPNLTPHLQILEPLDWNFFTPLLKEISVFIRVYYDQYKSMDRLMNLEFWFHDLFFNGHIFYGISDPWFKELGLK